MVGFYTWKDLFDYMQWQFKEALFEIIEDLTQHTKDELTMRWYNRSWYTPTSTSYQRTYQLLQAISWKQTRNQKGLLEFEIFYDESKIVPTGNPEEEGWTKHRSKYDGEKPAGSDFVTELTEVMEHGNPSPVYGWSESQAPKPFEWTEAWTRKFIIEYIQKALYKRGILVVPESMSKYYTGE